MILKPETISSALAAIFADSCYGNWQVSDLESSHMCTTVWQIYFSLVMMTNVCIALMKKVKIDLQVSYYVISLD